MAESNRIFRDRQLLMDAHKRGPFATFLSFFRLSGPGWLQGAITLGGGSLGSALYLGAVGGTNMMWLMLISIVIGVIMLSAISYVTLSTGRRPYEAINEYVNPVLGVSWITATILANLIWIMPQFSLCFDTLVNNLGGGSIQDDITTKVVASVVIFLAAFAIILLSLNRGWIARIFDVILKLLVTGIIVCFVAVAVYLFRSGAIDWSQILGGFIPNVGYWNQPTPAIAELMDGLSDDLGRYWTTLVIEQQRNVMISTTATAVGINMTFLLPYSMLARGWDRPFRGLARFDLWTGLAIPFVLVTSCIVMAAANGFHAKADDDFLSADPEVVKLSPVFKDSRKVVMSRMLFENESVFEPIALMPKSTDEEKTSASEAETDLVASFIAGMSPQERKLSLTLVKPNTGRFAKSLEPVLKDKAGLVFGLGAFAMGFSTIVILMLINGFATAEVFKRYDNVPWRIVGSLVAGLAGIAWIWIWGGSEGWAKESKTWLVIMASTFGAILLPIAYIAFFALMNNRELLGDDKPTGRSMWIWNLLMLICVLAALVQSSLAIMTKVKDPATGNFVIGGAATFAILALFGFSARVRRKNEYETDDEQQ